MRLLSVLTAIFFMCSSAWARTCDNSFPELSSKYEYVEKMTPQYKADVQKVFHYGGQGEEEVTKLKEKGYDCRRRGEVLSLCRKMNELKEIPAKIQEKIRNQYSKRSIRVSPATQSAENLFCGESSEGWKFYRKVSFGEKTFENYELHSLEQKKVLKLYLEDKNDQDMFKIEGDQLWLRKEFRDSHENGWTRFAIWVQWSPRA